MTTSAAKRTLSLPGVDLKDHPARPLVQLELTPIVWRVVLRMRAAGSVSGMHEDHLLKTRPSATSVVSRLSVALCGAEGWTVDEPQGKRLCQACRVEASRLRAVVRDGKR
jgi:hypothetical protein